MGGPHAREADRARGKSLLSQLLKFNSNIVKIAKLCLEHTSTSRQLHEDYGQEVKTGAHGDAMLRWKKVWSCSWLWIVCACADSKKQRWCVGEENWTFYWPEIDMLDIPMPLTPRYPQASNGIKPGVYLRTQCGTLQRLSSSNTKRGGLWLHPLICTSSETFLNMPSIDASLNRVAVGCLHLSVLICNSTTGW